MTPRHDERRLIVLRVFQPELDVTSQRLAQRGQRVGVAIGDLVQLADEPAHQLFADAENELVAVLEMEVDGRRRAVDSLGHLAHRQTSIAVSGEDVPGGIDDVLSPEKILTAHEPTTRRSEISARGRSCAPETSRSGGDRIRIPSAGRG